MAKKYYVVWVGRETGIFTSWAETKKLIDQFSGAKYKSYKTEAEAKIAFSAGKYVVATSQSSKASKPRPTKKSAKDLSKSNAAIHAKFDVVIYCDGGCDPNPGKSASGVAVYRAQQLSSLWYGLYNPRGTNNSAELNALNQSLRIAQKAIKQDKSAQILCDSQYSINCVTNWAYSWKKKGWKRKIAGDIKNLDIIQQAHELYDNIRADVNVAHVRAHIGIEGNELADRMSIYGISEKNKEFCKYEEPLDIPKIMNLRAG